MSTHPLFSEQALSFSPTLAATIGLEEAILVEVLRTYATYCQCKQSHQRSWFHISRQSLHEKLSFWSLDELNQNLKRLFCKGLIVWDTTYTPASEMMWLAINVDQSDTPAQSATSNGQQAQSSHLGVDMLRCVQPLLSLVSRFC